MTSRWTILFALLSSMVLIGLGLATNEAHAEAKTSILVFPATPATQTVSAEKAINDAGFIPRALGSARESMLEAGRAEAQRREAARAKLSRGLEQAQASYLNQDFDKMLKELGSLRSELLWFLGEPNQRAILWDLTFQIGLAHRARNQSEDQSRAIDEFALAHAINEGRRPPSDIFGPDVGQAFAKAIAAREKAVGRPIDASSNVKGASLTIDGIAIIGDGGVRALKPGLHVFHYSAVGWNNWAKLIDTRIERSLLAKLKQEEQTTVAIGKLWQHSNIRPGTAPTNQALRELANQLEATAVLFIDPDQASLIDSNGLVRTVPTAKLASLLGQLDDNGAFQLSTESGDTLSAGVRSKSRSASASHKKTWYIVGGIVGVAVAAVTVGLLISNNGNNDRISIGIAP